MHIRFQKLTLKNYKSHRDLTVDFGELTKITGDNAKGKSSIPESLCWTLYGTDSLGSKLDPTPIGYAFDEVKAELLLSVDEKQVLLGRGIAKGKTKYWVNEVPSKATELDELVQSLFDKDLFLSLFNPAYFPSLHWEAQRKLILQYVTSPANKEVFGQLPPAQADKLADLVKKHSLAELDKIHRENKNKQDKAYIAAQSRTKTLLQQLNSLPEYGVDIDEATEKVAQLDGQIMEIERTTEAAADTNRKYTALQSQIKSLQEQVSASAGKWPELRDEQIVDTCRTCKQALQDEAVKAVADDKNRRVQAYKEQHAALVAKRKEAEAQLEALEYIDVSEQLEKIRALEQDKLPYLDAIKAYSRRAQLEDQIEQAKVAEAETLASRNESVFILDAIKAFEAKEAELQAGKVQDLFTTLSIRLFKQNKGDGELKPDFEIEMDGKPYRKLSLSESIRAGLELRDVLSQQSGIVAPCIVDNAESITRFTQPNGQLIMCRVVAGQDLKIETEDEVK
ncbi:AAA family ATPase [Brevibacillus sp. HD3.3A]|uniref:AAA family ATPase n=1 Tax=Brevibacillus sp. HD3.3A TaxID=2738979 RepID=UPI00156B3C36|nr:AAA family ATPase [Brevibacillus sp. HD3.3A]UED70734.1 AAA family ATPase [Brevibacillus sp. HD3.3A]